MTFQIVSAPVPTSTGDKSDWQFVRAHKAGCLVLDALPFKDHMAVLVRENALPRIILVALADNDETDIAFDEEAYDVSFGSMAEYDSANLRFTYASMTTPTQTFDFDMVSGARALRKTQNVPSGHAADDYVTRRITATGHDGAQIPVSLLYHKDTPLGCQRTGAALWLWLLWHHHSGGVFRHPFEPGRSRFYLCHRPYSRRARLRP